MIETVLQPSNEYNCSGSVTLTDGEEGGEQEVLIREVTVNTLVDRLDKKSNLILKLFVSLCDNLARLT